MRAIEISACAVGQITFRSPPVSRPTQGAYRDRHERGCGMRWTRCCRLTSGTQRTAKSCGPDVSTLTSTSRWCFRITRGMVARKPDRQGEHEGNRKTIAQGMPAYQANL